MLGDEDTMERHSTYENTNTRVKLPKRVDYWFYLETKNNLSEQIRYLRDQIQEKNELLAKYTNPVQEVKENVRPQQNYKPVGGRVNPIKHLAELEAKEMHNYWRKEVERRERIMREQGNVSELNSEGVNIPSEENSQENTRIES